MRSLYPRNKPIPRKRRLYLYRYIYDIHERCAIICNSMGDPIRIHRYRYLYSRLVLRKPNDLWRSINLSSLKLTVRRRPVVVIICWKPWTHVFSCVVVFLPLNVRSQKKKMLLRKHNNITVVLSSSSSLSFFF